MSVRIPLHGKARKAHQLLDLWNAMQALNPRGFRDAPSSRKNPRFHSPKPTTRIEALAKAAEWE